MNTELQIRNQLFYNSLTKLVDRTIEKYHDLDKSDLPVRPILKLKEFGNETKYEHLDRPGYELIVTKNIDINNLQEFKDCINVITNDEILSSNYFRLIEIGNSKGVHLSGNTLALLCSRALQDYDGNTDYKHNLLNSYLDLCYD